MTSVSLGKTRFKIKPSILNFITARQAYCSYPLNPYRLVFPCLWQWQTQLFPQPKHLQIISFTQEFTAKNRKRSSWVYPDEFLPWQMRNSIFGTGICFLIHDYLSTCLIFLHWIICVNCIFIQTVNKTLKHRRWRNGSWGVEHCNWWFPIIMFV